MFRKLLLVLLLLWALPALAQENANDGFQMTGSRLNAEAEKAEICLIFSRPINFTARSTIATSLRLEKDGTRVRVSTRDLSLTPQELCIQQLEHRHRYQLRVLSFRDREGNKLEDAVRLNFEVPDRKPSLAIVEITGSKGLSRYGEKDKKTAPNIRALNVKAARLTLYHLDDRKTFVEAMQQEAQLRLAPSESVYFASQRGKVVWQSELVFGDKPNVEQTLVAPLPTGKNLPPGLYFLAVAPQAKSATTAALSVGQWFLVSNIHLSVIAGPDSYYAFVTETGSSRPAAGISVQLLGPNGDVLAEGASDKDGMAMLALPKDKDVKPAYVTALSAAGDVDLQDLSRRRAAAYAPTPNEAILMFDRPTYLAGSTATIMLMLRNEQGHLLPIRDSSLKLMRPGYQFVGEYSLSSDKAEVVFKKIPLPRTTRAGDWHLLWQKTDGTVLAERDFRVTLDGVWPRLDITMDRDRLDPENNVLLYIKAVDGNNKPLAWTGGRIEAQLSRPEFAAWKDYRFGVGPEEGTKPLIVTRFITGADGMAKASVPLSLPEDAAGTRAVTFKVTLDRGGKPVTLSLPVVSESGWVGIRPLPDERPFSENSIAAFDIMALDANGKRRPAGELYYHVYEEGRSFNWYQAEGHWDYQPLPRHRRIGGGRFAITASGDNVVHWPVTAGHYILEITDAEGAVVAQYGFQAIWNQGLAVLPNDQDMTLKIPNIPLESKKTGALRLMLSQPAMVSLLIGDSRVRQAAHRFFKAGEQAVEITPASDWGAQGQIVAHAVFVDGHEETVSVPLEFRQGTKELGFDLSIPSSVQEDKPLTIAVTIPKDAKTRPSFIKVLATPLDLGGVSGSSSLTSETIPVDREGRATWRLTPSAGQGGLILFIVAWNENQYALKTVMVPVKAPIVITGAPPSILAPGDRTSFAVTVKGGKSTVGKFAYAVAAPKGVRLIGAPEGAISLKAKKQRDLSFDLIAEKSLLDNMTFGIKGPNNILERRVWPLRVRGNQFFALPIIDARLEKGKSLTLGELSSRVTDKDKGKTAVVMVSPVPLVALPQALQSVLMEDPATTEERAVWLEAARQWQSTVTELGLASREALRHQRQDVLHQLEASQNPDGGFSVWSSINEGDLASTAAALLVLHDESSSQADTAARWLEHQLENTWFEEAERPARAFALFALASTGHENLSSLRYFADTSRDKDLEPDVAAMMALALTRSHDDDTARFWLKKAQAALPFLIAKKSPAVWAVLRMLAQNNLLAPNDVKSDLEYAANILPDAQQQTGVMLAAMGAFLKRTGTWNFVVNGKNNKVDGVFIGSYGSKAQPLVLKNLSDFDLFVARLEGGAISAERPVSPDDETPITIKRELYRLDGTLVEPQESLVRGETYLLLIQGVGKQSTERALQVHIPYTAALPLMLPGNGDASSEKALWPWLPSSLTEIGGATTTSSAISFEVPLSKVWSVACLLKANNGGTYTLPPARLRDSNGDEHNVTQNTLRWVVR